MALLDAQQISLGGLYEGGAELIVIFGQQRNIHLCNGWDRATLFEELMQFEELMHMHNPFFDQLTHEELYNIGVQIMKYCSVWDDQCQNQYLEFTKEKMTDFNHWFLILKFEKDLKNTMWNYGISYEEVIASIYKIHLIEPIMES